MQLSFTTLAFTFSLLGSTFADLHMRGICVDETSGGDVYNEAATIAACAAYKAVNWGTEQWQTCPDCVMLDEGYPHCRSDGWHLGGDEITGFCRDAGADNALTS